ncbi:MAG: HAD family phosphatase [Opitutales bacterium]|nr:HAD family phosphatase [Opitutales bacterium]
MKIGCIFDWDGTVVDSGRTHEFTWIELAKAHNFELIPNFFEITFGVRNIEIITDILKWTKDMDFALELSEEKENLYRKIVAERGVPTIKGVEAFLKSINDVGCVCAIGSSTPRKNLDITVAKLGFEKYFKAYAASEDVTKSKPAPDVFLKAAERIGVSPENCIVFEDSFMGIKAGVSAGMKTVAVATTNSMEALANASQNPECRIDIITRDFEMIAYSDIKNLF